MVKNGLSIKKRCIRVVGIFYCMQYLLTWKCQFLKIIKNHPFFYNLCILPFFCLVLLFLKKIAPLSSCPKICPDSILVLNEFILCCYNVQIFLEFRCFKRELSVSHVFPVKVVRLVYCNGPLLLTLNIFQTFF